MMGGRTLRQLYLSNLKLVVGKNKSKTNSLVKYVNTLMVTVTQTREFRCSKEDTHYLEHVIYLVPDT